MSYQDESDVQDCQHPCDYRRDLPLEWTLEEGYGFCELCQEWGLWYTDTDDIEGGKA